MLSFRLKFAVQSSSTATVSRPRDSSCSDATEFQHSTSNLVIHQYFQVAYEKAMAGKLASPSTAAALTSLLNSLHTHLQSQTQFLPTLHAQLGLPATALEDELKSLQKQLIEGVEKQIDMRRKEVDQWTEKCDRIEVECIRYSTALGGNIKATGSSVGELRKENVLPRRFEMVSEYQEKLRQVSLRKWHISIPLITLRSYIIQSSSS